MKQAQDKFKQIDTSDFDINQVKCLQNSQSKTLKKPIREMAVNLVKTNPKGVGSILQDTYKEYHHQ